MAASFIAQWRADVISVCRHFRHHVLVYLGGSLMLGLLSMQFAIGINVSSSLPYRVALIDKGAADFQRGDLVVYRFHGTNPEYGGGLNGQWFFKRLAGQAGDRITVTGSNVFVNGAYMGFAKPLTHDRKPLGVIEAGAIPPGFFYAQGDHPDSFDSRYRQSGLIPVARVVGRAHVLF